MILASLRPYDAEHSLRNVRPDRKAPPRMNGFLSQLRDKTSLLRLPPIGRGWAETGHQLLSNYSEVGLIPDDDMRDVAVVLDGAQVLGAR